MCPRHAPWPLPAALSTLLLEHTMCRRFTLSTKNLFAHFTNPDPAICEEGARQPRTSPGASFCDRLEHTSLFQPSRKLWGHHQTSLQGAGPLGRLPDITEAA